MASSAQPSPLVANSTQEQLPSLVSAQSQPQPAQSNGVTSAPANATTSGALLHGQILGLNHNSLPLCGLHYQGCVWSMMVYNFLAWHAMTGSVTWWTQFFAPFLTLYVYALQHFQGQQYPQQLCASTARPHALLRGADSRRHRVSTGQAARSTGNNQSPSGAIRTGHAGVNHR